MHANECWACRDSRAACNRVRPRCSKCAKSNRPCQYGLRLSWPKATNTKRSLTYSIQDVFGVAKSSSQTSFINATSWDIQLHDYLRMNQGLGSYEGFVFQKLDPPMALSWLPINLGYEERELLDHFICTASSTLAIFEPDKNEFLGLLVRLALLDSSPSSAAVLQSALALSSLHRHGPQADVFQFKARSLRTLITSYDHCLESQTVVQHIAACMILCHLEVRAASYGSHEILQYLHVTFEMIKKPTDSLYHSDEYENSLRCLENRITSIVLLAPEGISDTTSSLGTAWVATMELFKLAAIIYLKRASRNFSGTSPQIDAIVERAYILLDELETFNPAFPLLIIGCEARRDGQRIRILEHIERAMKASSLRSRSMLGLQNILQQIWVQDDLAVDYELDYLNKLDAVITSHRIMPSFV
ncbi:hypothetical protein VE04_04851 [Pseudogymnoascus sp. 24MN13]|nr:hypothetical protein VE04_04851 [Pseudogymnoascus sp. 24MN13]